MCLLGNKQNMSNLINPFDLVSIDRVENLQEN